MSSMFRKKRSSSSLHHQPPSNTTPSATTAAVQAFRARQSEESQLSNAAAAAALRSYTPTPVGDVQTKRMVRRGSTSSLGSSASNQRQPFSSNLQRRGSNGSMTQRSFRTPSPARNATPPVPALPQNIPPLPNNGVPSVPLKSSRRNGDVPRNVVSPPPSQQRPKSMESSRWASQKSQPFAQADAVTRARDTASPTSPTGSPRNINFSRPMSPQMTSPPPNIRNMNQSPQPAASLGLSPEQYRRLEERREASRLQEQDWIERERKRNEAQRLAKEGAQAKVAQAQAQAQAQSSSRPVTPSGAGLANLPKQRQAGTSPARSARAVSMPMGSVPPLPTNRISSAPNQRPRVDTQSAAAPHSRQPEILSASATESTPQPSVDQIKAFQTRAASLLARPLTDKYTSPSKPLPKSATTNSLMSPSTSKQHNRSVSSPIASSQQTPTAGRGRAPSASPGRSAHFSAQPLLEVTKHTPPARSVSPVKSALKGSSPRGMSPAHNRDISTQSDAGSVLSDESSVPSSSRKKKSVRVSFEERPVMVGQAAETLESPLNAILSPQYKTEPTAEEQDFSMSPRPVLPSFGSVRGRKNVTGADTAEEDAFKTETAGEKKAMRDTAAALQEDDSDDEDSSPALSGPQIAVQPATPNFEAGNAFASQPQPQQPKAHDLEGVLSAEDAPSAAGSHPKPVVDNQLEDAAAFQTATRPQPVVVQEDSDTDEGDNERFSDSVEDQSELDAAGGFTSLDAILESPATEAKESEVGLGSLNTGGAIPIAAMPSQEISTVTAFTTVEPVPASTSNAPAEDWNQARAYWSSLSEQQKQALESNKRPKVATGPQREPAPKPQNPAKLRSRPNGSLHQSSQPTKSALKQPRPQKPAQPAASTEPTHFRMSMRQSGSMMSSMRGAPERSPSRGSPQSKPKAAEPQASADAIALAQATAKAMAAKDAERKASREAAKQDEERGRTTRKDGDYKYSLSKSMRDGRAAAPAPASSPHEAAFGRTSMRSTARHSVDSTSEGKGSGFLRFGKSKPKPIKPKKAGGGGGRRFGSRFADSSDEDSDGGGGRMNFRSRFADSDDSDDNAPVKPMKIRLAPVRGIPRLQGQEEGDSTELEDSDEEASKPTEPALPRSSKERPGTPPASAVLSFGKSPNPAGIETSKHAPAAATPAVTAPPMAATEAMQDESAASPTSPKADHADGSTAEGKVLAAGTLRDNGVAKDREKRHSILGFGRKHKSAEQEQQPPLAESKWANAPTSPSSRPQTPSKGFAKTLRDNKGEKDKEKEKRNSMLRRLSFTSRDSSAPTTPTGGKLGKEDYPFPPPPIPEQYRTTAAGYDEQRPTTSDGVSSPTAVATEATKSPDRPALGNKQDSAMTAPDLGRGHGTQRKGKLTKEPVVSKKTGKAKKFQGLRRAFGLND